MDAPEKASKRTVNTLWIVLGLALLAFIGLRFFGGGPHPLEGKAAPSFTLQTLEGETLDLAALKGEKVILLDFWASWCPPCRKGLPVVAGIAREFEDRPVAVYGINVGESPDQARAFIEKSGLDLAVAADTDGAVASKYGVRGIPQTVVIGRDGIITDIHVGLSLNFDGKLRSAVEEALQSGAGGE